PETFFDSVRVTEGDGVTLLPVWLQEPNIVWARYPTANTTYFLYWGNSEAEAIWNSTAVFIDIIDGVVGAWMMNEPNAEDSVVDYSGNGNNGTPVNVTVVDGKYAGTKAKSFDGSTSYVGIPHIADYNFRTNEFTLIIVAKMQGSGDRQVPLRIDTNEGERALIGFLRLSSTTLVGEFYDSKIPPPFENQNKMTTAVTFSTSNFSTFILWRTGDDLFLEQNGDGEIKTVNGVLNHDLNNPVVAGHSYVGIGLPVPHVVYHAEMICAGAYLVEGILTDTERFNISENYPDPSLEAGKVLVRKWLTLSAFDFYTIPPVILSGETYYFRSDSYQVNTVTAYGLDVDYTNTAVYLSSNGATGATVQYGFRIYQLHTGGGKTELTGGSPEAAITLSSNSSGYQTATWSCAETDWDLGRDAIQIAVYVKFDSGNWIAVANYVTPSIMSGTLEASTWTFRVYLYYLDNGASTQTRFYFGSGTYHSEISGIAFTEASIFDMMMFSLMVGDLIMFFRLPLDLLFGSWWYFLLILAVAGAFYIRYRNLVVILVLWTLFAGAGGLVGLLIPNPIDMAIWVLLSLGLTAVLWRVFR
ncbi:MAG: hypothetical protein WCS62_02345, partial [Bacilli bacterium]